MTPSVGLEQSLTPSGAGTLTPTGSGFDFLPAVNFSGTATFVYQVMQGDSVSSAAVTIQVASPPTQLQAVDDTVSVPFNDGSITTPIAIAVLGNDTLDPEIAASVGLQQSLTPSGAGTLTPTGSGFNFLPAANFSGEATFVYQLIQGEAVSSATVTLQIAVDPGSAIGANPLLNPEERRVATAIGNACAGATGALAESCGVILALPPEQQQSAIRQIQPNQVPAQAMGAFLQQNQQLSNLRGRLDALRNGARGLSFAGLGAQLYDQSVAFGQWLNGEQGGSAGDDSAFADTPWGLFVTGRINFGDVEERGSQEDFDFETLGLTAGIDYRLDRRLVLGAALGFGTSENDFGSDRGSLDVDSWSLSFYGNYYPLDSLYLDWVVGYGRNDYSGDRRLQFGPVDTIADYDADGDQYSASATVGYQTSWQAWQYGGYLRFDYIHTSIDDYAESGGAGLALAIAEQNSRSLESALGARLGRAFSLRSGVLIPGIELEWVHQWQGDPRRIMATFAEAPDSGSFSIQTESQDENYLQAGLSLTGVFTGGKSGFLRYQTGLGRDQIDDQTIEVGFRIEF
jgi:outer membrane autotransporter protein